MNRLITLAYLLKERFGYKQPVYDPNYSYNPWKKRIGYTLLVLFVLGMVGGSGNQSNNANHLSTANNKDSNIRVSKPDKPKMADNLEGPYRVLRIIDGDTLDVDINNKSERLRLIGIDTPETKDPRKPIQCFGKEASSKMQNLVQSKSVWLKPDDSQDARDKYGRLLVYVFLDDGLNVGYEMVKGGYAHEYTYNLPYKYQSQFKAAEKYARDNNKGLWSSKACSGDTEQTVDNAPQSSSSGGGVSQPAPTSAPRQTNSCDPNYSPCIPNVSYDLNCPDIGVMVQVIGSDHHNFDRNGDGYGCESYG